MSKVFSLIIWSILIFFLCLFVFVIVGAVEHTTTGKSESALGLSYLIGLILEITLINKLFFKKKKEKLNKQHLNEKLKHLVDEFEIIVTGIYYNSEKTGEKRQDLIRKTNIYDPVTFERDLNNNFDDNAVFVLNNEGVDLGYVKSSETYLLTPYLNENYFIDACIEKKNKTVDGQGLIIHVTIREHRKENQN